MVANEWFEKLDELKSRVDTDRHADAAGLEAGRTASMAMVEGIARGQVWKVEEVRLLIQLRDSVGDYYDPRLSRSWSHYFLLNDINKMKAALHRRSTEEIL